MAMDVMIVFFICLTLSYILSEVLKKIGLPKVLGPILVGFGLSAEPIKHIMFPESTLAILSTFKEIGLIFLLFFIGLKIDLKEFKKTSKRSFLVAFFGALVPFILGFGMSKLFGLSTFLSVVVGIVMSVTEEAVAIQILEELKLVRTKIGETIIEAGIIDDILAILSISAIVAFFYSSEPGIVLLKLLFEILVFAFLLFAVRYSIVPKVLHYVERGRSKIDLFAVSIIMTLFLAGIAKYLGISSILGALFAGIIIRHVLFSGPKEEQREEREITELIEITTFAFLAPFFFIWIGLNTDLSILVINPLFGIAITAVAFAGKVIGAMLGNSIIGGSHRESLIIGWGMNVRGAVALIVAELARELGIIPPEIFSALVFMAFVTTILSPAIFKFIVRAHHKARKDWLF